MGGSHFHEFYLQVKTGEKFPLASNREMEKVTILKYTQSVLHLWKTISPSPNQPGGREIPSASLPSHLRSVRVEGGN